MDVSQDDSALTGRGGRGDPPPTAVPAVLSILEHLPRTAHGEAVLEVPHPHDITHLATPAGYRVTWLVSRPDGSALPAAAEDALRRLVSATGPVPRAPMPDRPADELVWEVPSAASQQGLYAWVAGESSLVTGLRRRLVRGLGVDRDAVAFMGYWRTGRAAD